MDNSVARIVRFYPNPFIANSKCIYVVGVRKVPMVNLNIVGCQSLLKEGTPKLNAE